MDALECLMTRESAFKLTAPAPTDEALEQIISCAVRAPDHGGLRPWKFIVVRDEVRSRFADLFGDLARRSRPDATEEMIQAARNKAMRAPMVLVTVCKLKASKNIPPVEQLLSAGAAAQNIMLTAHALGYGAMWKTGKAAYDEQFKRELGLNPEDSIVGFFHIGTRSAEPAPVRRPRPEASEYIENWGV